MIVAGRAAFRALLRRALAAAEAELGADASRRYAGAIQQLQGSARDQYEQAVAMFAGGANGAPPSPAAVETLRSAQVDFAAVDRVAAQRGGIQAMERPPDIELMGGLGRGLATWYSANKNWVVPVGFTLGAAAVVAATVYSKREAE